MVVEELLPAGIQLDGGPGMRLDQSGEIARQLLGFQPIRVAIEPG